ncbi:MAG: tetratricopeptide repeat protein [Myxococcales bacterium]|nr:tetratricopeptide repeat protein [Myxococcales bacterium]
MEKGKLLEENGELEAALAQYFDALNDQPSPEIHFNIGITLTRLEQFEAALIHFEKAKEQHYRVQEVTRQQALALLQLRRENSAVALLLQVSDRTPELNLTLGQALRQAGEVRGAYQAYQKVLRQDPKHPRALLRLGWLADRVFLDFEEALALYEQYLAVAQDTEEAEVVRQRRKYLLLTHKNLTSASEDYSYSWKLFQLGRYHKLRAYYRSHLPEFAEDHFFYGRGLFATGNKAGGIEELQIAVRKAPNQPLYLLSLLAMLKQEGRQKEYLTWLEFGRNRFPNEPYFSE